ncbi:MAG: substrate-binding domain-containing protein [Gemmatimonadota bacterium]|nr:substrate-binding domain-containing protein [Gemmatimonadota bacterium]MDH5803875.1 substrate-binding domain-containing protein [Gemmatimonadota bacterium]
MFAVFCLGLSLPGETLAAQGIGDREIVLATTTSVRDAGLLRELLPRFEERTGFYVKVLAVGTGQAMAMGREGIADILILHDPVGELQFMRDGYATRRCFLMQNNFLLVGPGNMEVSSDSGGVLEKLRRIVDSGSTFLSRGDSSGTHAKELDLWRRAGIDPSRGDYRESGQGMSATLQIANEIQAYTLVDLGTFLAHRSPIDLTIVEEADSLLTNRYHVLNVDSRRFPWINERGARSFEEFLLSPQIQANISAFRRVEFGRSLFESGQALVRPQGELCGQDAPSPSSPQ